MTNRYKQLWLSQKKRSDLEPKRHFYKQLFSQPESLLTLFLTAFSACWFLFGITT